MKVTILSLNIRGFLHHQTELEAFLRVHGLPSIVGITETLLDASTKNIYCLNMCWYRDWIDVLALVEVVV